MRYTSLVHAIGWANKHGLRINADSKSVKVDGAMSLRQAGTVDYFKANGYSVRKG